VGALVFTMPPAGAAAGTVLAAGAAGAAMLWPQLGQNAVPSATCLPHLVQNAMGTSGEGCR